MSARPSGFADPELYPLDATLLRAGRLERVRSELRARSLPAVLLYDPVNIRYATDVTGMQLWTMHNFSRYAFVPADGPVVLFEFPGCEHLSQDFETVGEVRPATSWYYWGSGSKQPQRVAAWAAELSELLAAAGGTDRRLAVDRIEPLGVAALSGHGIELLDGQPVMEHARAIKSSLEIEAMKIAVRACEAGIDAMRSALRPGVCENELWAELHRTNIARGGEWIETRLLASGPRTNPWLQECGPRRIEDGDLVAFDTDLIGPFGYCADISRTWRCGDGMPSDEQRRLYAAAREQVARIAALLRPGLSFRELSERGSELPVDYRAQHYVCVVHGVGLKDEYPAVPYPEDFAASGYEGRLEENMAICVESYVGTVGGREGVKLEDQMLVTANGAVALSTTPYEEHWL